MATMMLRVGTAKFASGRYRRRKEGRHANHVSNAEVASTSTGNDQVSLRLDGQSTAGHGEIGHPQTHDEEAEQAGHADERAGVQQSRAHVFGFQFRFEAHGWFRILHPRTAGDFRIYGHERTISAIGRGHCDRAQGTPRHAGYAAKVCRATASWHSHGVTPVLPNNPRLPGVDVLRGLCILSVVLHHIHLRFTTARIPVNDVLPATLNQILFWSGLYAVIAFFVISGFLITSLSIRRWNVLGTIDAGRFYRMRMARILLCLLLSLGILTALHFVEFPGATMYGDRASLSRSLLAALTFHMNWLEGHYGWSPPGWGVLWSLSIEEVF